MKAYIAGPWFNAEQMAKLEQVKRVLQVCDVEYFSPKDESMFKQGDDPKQILDLNCKAINDCDFIVVITDGKDVGTMFEAGYAYCIDKQILYVWFDRKEGQKFNLMLGASGAVAFDSADIIEQIGYIKQDGRFDINYDKGIIYE